MPMQIRSACWSIVEVAHRRDKRLATAVALRPLRHDAVVEDVDYRVIAAWIGAVSGELHRPASRSTRTTI